MTTVSIEEQAGNKWRAVQNAVVDGTGAFQVTVPATATAVRYRARYGSFTSQKVVVQAAAPDPDPEPDPDPPPAPSDACGPQPKKADGTYWVCTLANDFTGTTLNRAVWMPQTIFKTGTPSAWACYIDDPSVSSVHDGVLDLTVRKLAAPAPCAGHKRRDDAVRRRHGLDVPAVQPAVRPVQARDQKHRHHRARPAGSVLGVARRPLQHCLLAGRRRDRHLRRPAPSTRKSSIPFLHYTANDNGGPIPGVNTAWNCMAHRGRRPGVPEALHRRAHPTHGRRRQRLHRPGAHACQDRPSTKSRSGGRPQAARPRRVRASAPASSAGADDCAERHRPLDELGVALDGDALADREHVLHADPQVTALGK